jgi:hypothetical protein
VKLNLGMPDVRLPGGAQLCIDTYRRRTPPGPGQDPWLAVGPVYTELPNEGAITYGVAVYGRRRGLAVYVVPSGWTCDR